MIETLDGLVPSAAASLLIGTMAKGVALLSAALMLVWFCGTRHALWKSILLRAAIVGLLLLPVGAIVLTPIHLPWFSTDSGFLHPVKEDPELLAGPTLAGVETSGVLTAADAARALVLVYGLGLLVLLVRLARSALLASAVRGSVSRITAAHVLRRWHAWKWRLGVRRDLLARAIYWPIPLVWMLSGQLVRAQEQVCDDWAVKATGDPDGYAGSLLDIASQAHGGPSLALGLEMARAPQVIDRAERVVKTGREVLVRVNSVVGLVAVLVLAGYISTIAALKPAARMVASQTEPAWHLIQGELAALPVDEELPVRPLAEAGLSLPVAIPPAPVREGKGVRYHSAGTSSVLSVAEMAELQISAPARSRYVSTGSVAGVGYARPMRVGGSVATGDWREGLGVRSRAGESGVDMLGRPLAQVYEGAPRQIDRGNYYRGDFNRDVTQPLEHQAGH